MSAPIVKHSATRAARRLLAEATGSLTRSASTATPAVPRPWSHSASKQSLFSHYSGAWRPLQASAIRRGYATATTPHSSITNPAEEESQRHLELGTTALEAGNVEEAKNAYLKAIEIHETATAYFNLGVCYYHEKDTDKAIEAWKNTLRLSPEAADAHTNLASAYVMSKPTRPDLAVDHLKSAAQISPRDPEVQFNLGAVLEACEQLEEARKAYERAQEGGIQRAQDNIRNINAKILAVKLGAKSQGVAEAEQEATGSSSSSS